LRDISFRRSVREILFNPRNISPPGKERNGIFRRNGGRPEPILVFGRLGALTLTPSLVYYDRYIDENRGRCSKIFFSLKHDEYDDFVRIVDRARSGIS